MPGTHSVSAGIQFLHTCSLFRTQLQATLSSSVPLIFCSRSIASIAAMLTLTLFTKAPSLEDFSPRCPWSHLLILFLTPWDVRTFSDRAAAS